MNTQKTMLKKYRKERKEYLRSVAKITAKYDKIYGKRKWNGFGVLSDDEYAEAVAAEQRFDAMEETLGLTKKDVKRITAECKAELTAKKTKK